MIMPIKNLQVIFNTDTIYVQCDNSGLSYDKNNIIDAVKDFYNLLTSQDLFESAEHCLLGTKPLNEEFLESNTNYLRYFKKDIFDDTININYMDLTNINIPREECTIKKFFDMLSIIYLATGK